MPDHPHDGLAASIDATYAIRQPDDPEPSSEACCVCGGGPVTYRNYRELPFCQPCADCQCGENPCVRTGVNDAAVSAEAAARSPWAREGRHGPTPEEVAASARYDAAIRAPLSDKAANHIRQRLASGDAPRRRICRREPATNLSALDLIRASITAHEAKADEAHDADHPHRGAEHNAIAAGLRIAEAHILANPDAELEASQRRAVRIQQLLDDTRDRMRKIHRPAHYGGRIICAECSAYDGHSSTDSMPVDHPCPTIAALEPPKVTQA